MSGSTIGGVIGGVIGVWTGVGWQAGWMIGAAIGGAIDPQVIKAPSIGDAQQQTSQAGVPRPVVYGHPAPFAGNIIDGEGKARKITVKQQQGKGGGPVVKSERFLLTYAVRICEGPAKVIRIWRNGEVVYDARATAIIPEWRVGSVGSAFRYIAEMRAVSRGFKNRVRIYEGTEDQLPDPALEAIHGVGNTPYYRGTCYMVIENDDVTDTRGAAAQYRFEVAKSGVEESVSVVVPNAVSTISSWGSYVGSSTPWILYAHRRTVDVSEIRGVFRLGLASTYGTPVRLQVRGNGALLFDSGWIGDDVHAAELLSVLSGVSQIQRFKRVGEGEDVSVETEIINDPTTIRNYLVSLGNALSGEGPVYSDSIPIEGITELVIESIHPYSSGGNVTTTESIQYPDPALLPESVTWIPDDDGMLLGSDGLIYRPEWLGPLPSNVILPDEVVLASVVEDVAERCNVPAAKIDTSALTDLIPGFLVGQQFTGADCLRPLQQAFFFDMPEVDGAIRAIKRGGATVADVTDDDLIESDDHETVRAQAVEYPLKVSVVTQEPAAEYAAIPQTSGRDSPDFEGASEVVVQLPVPFDATTTARIAHKMHKVLHSQAEGRIELALPQAFSRYVPSDTFNFRDRRWLIEEARYADGVCRWKAVYDRASAYTSTTAGQAPRPPELPESGLRGPTKLYVMDLPAWRDSDDALGLYVAVGGLYAGWRGAQVWISLDGGANYAVAKDFPIGATHGTTSEPLGAWESAEYPSIQTLTVALNESPDAVTRADVLRYANRAAVRLASGAWEILQFEGVTDNGDDSYTLSGLLRGRYDTTPGAIDAGAAFVVLDDSVAFIPVHAAQLGTSVKLKAISYGTAGGATAPVDVTVPSYTQSVREWPVHLLRWRRADSGDIRITWAGRARLGTDATPIHSQHFAGYRVSVSDGSTLASWDTTDQALTIPAAEQSAKWGSSTFEPTVTVVPISTLLGAAGEGGGMDLGTLADWTVRRGVGGWSIADGAVTYDPIAGGGAIGRLDFKTQVPLTPTAGIDAGGTVTASGSSTGAIAVAGYDAAAGDRSLMSGPQTALGRSTIVAYAPDLDTTTGAVALVAITDGTHAVAFSDIRYATL